MDFRIDVLQDATDSDVESVNALLRAHNQQANPALWDARPREENAPRPVQLLARDAAGQIVGGLLGSTQFSWLRVDIMAVEAALRGQGIGRALLERAEQAGRARGCVHAYVDTMEYQAPEFYRKAGYREAGRIEDWDSFGHTKFFFVKTLEI